MRKVEDRGKEFVIKDFLDITRRNIRFTSFNVDSNGDICRKYQKNICLVYA